VIEAFFNLSVDGVYTLGYNVGGLAVGAQPSWIIHHNNYTGFDVVKNEHLYISNNFLI